MDWEDFRVFLAVYRRGSYAGAAPSLGMVTATVRRRIEDLERAVGSNLFTANGRALTPTPAANELLPRVEAMERASQAFAAAAAAERSGAQGLVRVATTEVIGEIVLTPVFARLRARHPDIVIELRTTNGPVAFHPDGVDLGVLLERPRHDGLIIVDLGVIAYGLFAHRTLLDRLGRPTVVGDLRRFPLVGAYAPGAYRSLFARIGVAHEDRAFKVRTDCIAGQWAAVKAGLGVGVAIVPIAAAHADLERVLPDIVDTTSVCVAMHENQAAIARIEIVKAAITEGLKTFLREHILATPASDEGDL